MIPPSPCGSRIGIRQRRRRQTVQWCFLTPEVLCAFDPRPAHTTQTRYGIRQFGLPCLTRPVIKPRILARRAATDASCEGVSTSCGAILELLRRGSASGRPSLFGGLTRVRSRSMVIQRKQNYGWPDCTHWNDSEILGKLGQGVWCRENKVGNGQGQEENSRSEKETSES